MSWAWMLLAILPQPDFVVRAQCQIIELDHFYDGDGRLVFDQLICWSEYHTDNKLHVLLWKTYKPEVTKSVTLQVLRRGAEIWFDEQGQTVQVRSLSFYESWTQVDVEVLDREIVPPEQRPKIK